MLSHLRHGPLKRLGPVRTVIGDLYRTGLRVTGASVPTARRIGGYGPFLLHGKFIFSDIENWRRGHYGGFASCVKASCGKRSVVDVGARTAPLVQTAKVKTAKPMTGRGQASAAFQSGSASSRNPVTPDSPSPRSCKTTQRMLCPRPF